MNPSVSIILPTYQGAHYLHQTLAAIRNQRYNGEIEIIAIDSSSSDETVELLHKFEANVEVIPQIEFGHGKTRNRGVAKATGDVIVFMSQDALPVGDLWLQKLVEAVKDEKVGAAFARQLPRAEATPLERYFHGVIYPAKSRITRARKNSRHAFEDLFFSNVCSAARREVCLRFPFDESVIMCEDQFFARNLLLNGLNIVYAAKVEVIHSHHYDLEALFRRNFDSGYAFRNIGSMRLNKNIQRAARYIGGEVFYLSKQKKWRWLAQVPLYETTRIIALLLGGQGEKIPLHWRRKLSLHKSYWENSSSQK